MRKKELSFPDRRRLNWERAALRDYIELWGHRTEPRIQKRVNLRRERLAIIEKSIALRVEVAKSPAKAKKNRRHPNWNFRTAQHAIS